MKVSLKVLPVVTPAPPGACKASKSWLRENSDMKFAVILQRDEDGFIVASCPALSGCHSQGKTREEAIANITEAIRGYIASMRKHGEPLSATDVEEVTEGSHIILTHSSRTRLSGP